MATRNPISFFGSPFITTEKLNSQNYLSWFAVVEMWFLGQGHHDHFENDEINVSSIKVE